MEHPRRIYLDYAATTPVHPSVAAVMAPYASRRYGNPASLHYFGQEAAAAVRVAQQQLADFLEVTPGEIVFTSGATEANNMALRGVVELQLERRVRPHMVVSALEHPSVAEPARALEARGATVTWVQPSADGMIRADDMASAIRANTALLSLQYVNSETGIIQPVRAVGAALAALNRRRREPVHFHCDAVQAAPWLPCLPRVLGVDLLSLSSHKVYGPKGIGALFVRRGVALRSLLYGGDQQGGRRSGTLNVGGCVGFGTAVARRRGVAYEASRRRVVQLRSQLADALATLGFTVTVGGEGSAPGHVHARHTRLDAELMVAGLDVRGIAISAGSACAAGAVQPSETLRAMGWPASAIRRAVRFTLGEPTTRREVRETISALRALTSQSRRGSSR